MSHNNTKKAPQNTATLFGKNKLMDYTTSSSRSLLPLR